MASLKLTSEDTDPYDCQKIQKEQLLGDEQILLDIDFNDKNQISNLLRKGEKIMQSFKIEDKNETFDAIALWFELS